MKLQIFKALISSWVLFLGSVSLADSNHFSRTYSNAEQREYFRSFYSEVLRLVPADKMHQIVEDIVRENPEDSDAQIYAKLVEPVKKIRPGIFKLLTQYAPNVISNQRKVLSSQTVSLLNDKDEINGYLDIGTSGNYFKSFAKKFPGPVKGPKYLISDMKPSIFNPGDILQRGQLLRNFVHVQNEDFLPISDKYIPSESLDLVTMYVGLHHTPKEKLSGFIASINRVLREGGVFILRDHDKNNKTEPYMHLAHMTFNLAAGVTAGAEAQELRNFLSIDDWIEILEQHGFSAGEERLLQEGDPSENTMIRFTKIRSSSQKISKNQRFDENAMIQAKAFARKIGEYKRAKDQTFLTTPEWWIVWNSQDYAHFIKENGSYKFPYFKSMQTLTNVYLNSLLRTSGINLGYNFMDITLLTFQNTEYFWKGAFDKTVVKKNHTNPHIVEAQKKYGEFINHTPFYDFPYGEVLKEFEEVNEINDREASLFRTEYKIKAKITPFFRGGSKQAYGEETEFIHMIVKDSEDQVCDVDPRIEIVETFSNIKVLRVPRYKPFNEILLKIAKTSILVEEIAGNSEIQMAVESSSSHRDEFAELCAEEGICKILNEVPSVIASGPVRTLFEIKVDSLNQLDEKISQVDESAFIKHFFDY